MNENMDFYLVNVDLRKDLTQINCFHYSLRISLCFIYTTVKMNILAFGASASKNSINKQLATYVSGLFDGSEVEIVDLLDYNLPMFTVDIQNEQGIPDLVIAFQEKINNADLLIISLAEHNGSYTAWFKNLFDWLTRLDAKFLLNKKVFLLATSPGARGGQTVLETAAERFPRHGAEVVATFSLPHFNDHFDPSAGITHETLRAQLLGIVQEINND